MNLRLLLLIHGIVTLAAGVVLVVAPDLIPRSVGVRLDAGGNLIAYLLAAAEFGIAVLSFGSRTLEDDRAIRVIVWSFIVFHGSSALLEVYALRAGVSPALWANVIARAVIVGAFVHFGLRQKR
jgi:hypothetical protein